MNGADDHISEERFEQFLSMSFASRHRKESSSCIQFLLDQLTLFLGAQKSFIITKKNRYQAIFESYGMNNKDDSHCTIPIYEHAVNKCLLQKKGFIFKNNSNNGVNNGNLETFVLCLPILSKNTAEICVQFIKTKEAGQFFNSDLKFVAKIARIIAPLLRMHLKDIATGKISIIPLLEKELRTKYDFSAVVGHNPNIIELLELVTKVMDVDVPVLIEGESGTGKELIVRAIHKNSKRKKFPIVTVNCGAIPENLVESEFFGHEKGAFTGATTTKSGQFEMANNGTIFLDEISTLNLAMQVKLLRVLQWNEFTPVGAVLPKKVNVRVIAASNQKLSDLVEQKKFRADLYYRLNVLRLHILPLRGRKDDIPILCQYLIDQNCEKMDKPKLKISPDAMDVLMSYDFPGNVRELENIMQRAIILCDGNEINHTHLTFEVKINGKTIQKANVNGECFKFAKQRVVEQFEKQYITKMLIENRGIVLRAAKKSGMYEANFRAKMKQHDIDVNDIFHKTNVH